MLVLTPCANFPKEPLLSGFRNRKIRSLPAIKVFKMSGKVLPVFLVYNFQFTKNPSPITLPLKGTFPGFFSTEEATTQEQTFCQAEPSKPSFCISKFANQQIRSL